MATPAPIDAVVAMRSERRAGLWAMAAVIFLFCFYCTWKFLLSSAALPTGTVQAFARTAYTL